jgi:hypothetical protein
VAIFDEETTPLGEGAAEEYGHSDSGGITL